MLSQQSIEHVSLYTHVEINLLFCSVLYHLVCNALVHVFYSEVAGQCAHTIPNVRSSQFWSRSNKYK